MTKVRSLQRKLMPDTVGSDLHKQTSLQGIAIRAKTCKQHRFRDLYRLINTDSLLDAFKDLNKKAAIGVDNVTVELYQSNLMSNLENLAERLKNKQYRAKLVRRCYIPKANGKHRPLGILVLEDKIVQIACAKILNSIYEQDFLPFSYAYRPNKSAREAVEELTFRLQFGCFGYIVEADIKSFFSQIDHDWLLKMLAVRIDDRAFLGLIRKWLKAGILDTDGKIINPLTGTPQGGIVSPILANIYLHYALDLWFGKIVKPQCKGQAILFRYADDFVCAFRFQDEAERFYSALPSRLAKFNLQVADDKTQILRFSRFHPSMSRTLSFLGFELYWFYDFKGVMRVRVTTARDRFRDACKRISTWIKNHRHLNSHDFVRSLNRRLRGHYNYFGIRGNLKALNSFYNSVIRCVFKWLNRRGGKRKSFTWDSFNMALIRVGVATPTISKSYVSR